ncbi:energy transducer TonB [Pseudoxanthomonas koreensis]|uniref:energy transducer TonB n=1 Tax=Pseudoxanthomonas koreensis TaxID=266061 RepID=UPI0035A6FDF1
MAAAARSRFHWLQRIVFGRWTIVAGAFLLGLLLFALVWLRARQVDAPAEQPVQPAAVVRQAADPLPGPLPAGASTPPPAADGGARLVEEPAPPEVPLQPLPPSIEPADGAPVGTPVAVQPPQLLGGQPPPRYPAGALRRGESGTVVVQVDVETDGRPASLRIQSPSGSRELDRAAVEAVARWRFEPARDAAGQPVQGSLSVPVDFRTR